MPPANPPHIGIFDSGIGGLSVLRALRHALPQARFTYIADSRHTPWGDRAPEWIVARSLQLSAVLMAERADLVLVACNTATTLAINALRARWPEADSSASSPASSQRWRPAAAAASPCWRPARRWAAPGWTNWSTAMLQAPACCACPVPGLAEAIEQAGPDDEALGAMLDAIAATLTAARIDTVVLGCTHYPLVADALAQRLGPEVLLVDTTEAVARRATQLLGLADPAQCNRLGPAAAEALPPLPRLLATGPVDNLQRAADAGSPSKRRSRP